MGAHFFKLMKMFLVLYIIIRSVIYCLYITSTFASVVITVAAAARHLTENADLNIGHKKSGGAV